MTLTLRCLHWPGAYSQGFILMRTFTFLLLGMFASFAYAELEQYEIKPGDTLVQILKDKDYGSTYLELLPFVEQVLELNPAAFSGGDVDSIIPGSLLDLPENPNKPEPEPELVPVPLPEPVVIVPEPEPEPEPQIVIGEINTQKGTRSKELSSNPILSRASINSFT